MKQQISIKQAVVIGNTVTLECSAADCDKVRAVLDENKPLAAVIGTASQKAQPLCQRLRMGAHEPACR
jgi:hypothetical protein